MAAKKTKGRFKLGQICQNYEALKYLKASLPSSTHASVL